MKTSKNTIFYFVLFIWLIIQLITLDRVPLPWFDEVFFKSLSDNLSKNGNFYVPVTILEQEVKIYGFVYFILTAFSQTIIGNSIFGFRIVNFLAGLLVVYWFWKKNKENNFRAIWVLILLLDPFFNLCLHEARMDLTATLLLLLTFDSFSKPTYFNICKGSFFGGLALLTTLRSAFMGFGLGILLILSVYNAQKSILITLKKCLLSLSIVFIIYVFWILIAFGNFKIFFDYFLTKSTFNDYESSLAGWFVGGTLYIPKHQYLLLFLVLITISIALYQQKKYFFREKEIFIFVVLIVSFHILVKDYGQYSIFILCFYYLLLIRFVSLIKGKIISYLVLFLLFSFNLSYFILKNTQVFLHYSQRNPEIALQFIQKNIPKNSKVIGESLYMYAVRGAGSDYQLIEMYGTLENRERKQREIFKYQYLIVTKQSEWRFKNTIDYYFLKKPKLKKKAVLNIPIDDFYKKIMQFLPLSQNENDGYNATIYEIDAIK